MTTRSFLKYFLLCSPINFVSNGLSRKFHSAFTSFFQAKFHQREIKNLMKRFLWCPQMTSNNLQTSTLYLYIILSPATHLETTQFWNNDKSCFILHLITDAQQWGRDFHSSGKELRNSQFLKLSFIAGSAFYPRPSHTKILKQFSIFIEMICYDILATRCSSV